MKPPIEQAKDHILKTCLPLVKPHHKKMWLPCLAEDVEDYRQALELPEVKQALPKGVEVEIKIVTKDGEPAPDIVIATVEDAANGNLDRYLKSMGL